MAQNIDYARLRDHTLNSQNEEESVTVNTRALIDKVLARYSGEWTTLRELIQNAADASATKVVVKFETSPSASVPLPNNTDPSAHLKHVISNHTLKRLLVTNNGKPFEESDWSRLKRIAEGNPDETKIGAFGVGFYSVFADCESPFVSSDKQTMAFYWKKDSLFTRRGQLPDDIARTETCFVLDYRNTTSPVPNLLSICQFLSTSLTFVELESIELWLDDWNVFQLNKKAAMSVPITIPKDIETKSKEGVLRITEVSSQNIQIYARWINVVGWKPTTANQSGGGQGDADTRESTTPSLRTFFSRFTGSSSNNVAARRLAKEEAQAQQLIAEHITGISQASAFTRVTTVNLKSQVASSFAAELERATKKKPPKQTKIAILTVSHDQSSASLASFDGAASSKAADIITSTLPSKSGRIFIGFPTQQTSGLSAHISAPSLIPTVERESIDLNARYVRTWNSELLNMAGVACRIAYVSDLNTIRDLVFMNKPRQGEEFDVTSSIPAAVHALKQFTCRESTPLARVGQMVEESFWSCCKKASIEILSSRGVLPSADVRIASEDLSFVKGVPVVPEQLLKEAAEFISKLQDFGLITDITTSDIQKELEKQALSEEQLQEFLRWAGHKTKTNSLDSEVIKTLLRSTVVNIRNDEGDRTSNRPIALGEIKTFLSGSRIPPELPVPPNTIPFRSTKGLTISELQSFSWEELHIVPWLRWLMDQTAKRNFPPEKTITTSADFSSQILATISKNWDALNPGSKSTVVELLGLQTIIPTKLGMKKPADSYFVSVKLFDDLPTTNLPGVKEKFLKALGVRKTIELNVIFARLMSKNNVGGGGWSHVDLIRYLVGVAADIPREDIEQLKTTPLCPAEVDNDNKKGTSQYFKLYELFEPKDQLRALGLPVLQWPGLFNAMSAEGKFLKQLGLRAYPSVPELAGIMMKAHLNNDTALYEKALRYFIENHYHNNYAAFDIAGVALAFLPLQGGEKRRLTRPSDCFNDERASVLGYNVLRQDLRDHAVKFGVRTDPPMIDCANRLINDPPKNKSRAKEVFSYFGSRLGDMSNAVVDRLSAAQIVPVSRSTVTDSDTKTNETAIRMTSPGSCFLGNSQEYAEIFDYVDFGQQANVFLLKVGSKNEPNTTELTQLLVKDATRIFVTLGIDRYRNLLRKIHVNIAILKRDKLLWKDMKSTRFLLAFRARPSTIQSKSTGQAEDESGDVLSEEPETITQEAHLRAASQIVIVDDFFCYNLFKQQLLAAPQEESLEELYSSLGAEPLSSLVEEDVRLGPRSGNQKAADDLRHLILERARLFLHDQPPSIVRHDVKWLEKYLEVGIVQSISLTRKLRGHNLTHSEKRTATVQQSGRSHILSIVANFDIWQVSEAVVSLLLERTKTQSIMVFETFLTTSLFKLRARGYNVDRILRRRAEEAKIAETEKQRRQEEDRQDIKAPPLPIRPTTPSSENKKRDSRVVEPTPIAMPGAFNDSPEAHRPGTDLVSQNQQQQQQRPRGGGLLSQLTRHLGFDQASQQNQIQQLSQTRQQSQMAQNLHNFFSGVNPAGANAGDQPPPYSSRDPRTPTAVSPQRVQQNLQSAIAASRSHTSTSVFSRPQTNVVQEARSYCDERPAQDLSFHSTTSTGIPLFLSNSTPDRAMFMQQHGAGVDAFASILQEIGNIFALSRDTIHIFHDAGGNAMAFNSSGSLFFNYRFFAQLHLAGVGNAQLRAQAIVYWWVIACHELAHNLVGDHSSDHSYWLEAFVAQYFPAVAGRLVQIASAGVEAASGDGTGGGGARALTTGSGAAAQFERSFM